ncbi:MAG: hypothetical protein HY782_10430 [Chloroflexi bacterium]|nr:hypothetical protein [Chloroflexota bacterium]
MDGSQLPQARQDAAALDLAAKYAPIIYADEREPFPLVAAGYTIFEREAESPSFRPRRMVEWESASYPATCAVEYALWWDWDIGHLYELEHAWTFIGKSGEVVAVEASWHGMYGPAEIDGRPVVLKTHPVLLAQPGKHAMAVSPEPFVEIREWAEQEAGPDAGKDAVLETELFRGRLPKTQENDAKVTAHLKRLAFKPSWKFDKRFAITRPMLMPWTVMDAWIPARVAWWLEQI